MTANHRRHSLDAAVWHTSTYSDNGSGCVERGRLASGWQAVRDTKDRDAAGILIFGPHTWQSFVQAVRTGELDS
ncbi:DUF397 domain-containing protein [Streptomyces marincola]|uniref:DUF397 domain-containing protein n=1 Tax=Streptomyces marincola TaxID=2878388 RepID=A0A1W7D0C8_9ACTN|nr:DUF397 domain-containing protein [Streptomyces marincola]ARQ70513.1 hypothetical protein CAG99_18180 [Streptomyces marincola]